MGTDYTQMKNTGIDFNQKNILSYIVYIQINATGNMKILQCVS